MPLFVGRAKSINALEEAMANNQNIFLVAQKTPEEQYRVKNLYDVGTIANILQLLRTDVQIGLFSATVPNEIIKNRNS